MENQTEQREFEVNLKVKTHTKMDIDEVEKLIIDVLKQYFYEGKVEVK